MNKLNCLIGKKLKKNGILILFIINSKIKIYITINYLIKLIVKKWRQFIVIIH
jgi:hypothetical protein